MIRYVVTYEIVTLGSAEFGDAEERGYIHDGCATPTYQPGPNPYTLRDALKDLYGTRTNAVDGREYQEAIQGPHGVQITVGNGMEYLTGARESRTLHLRCTDASAARLVRLLGITNYYD